MLKSIFYQLDILFLHLFGQEALSDAGFPFGMDVPKGSEDVVEFFLNKNSILHLLLVASA